MEDERHGDFAEGQEKEPSMTSITRGRSPRASQRSTDTPKKASTATSPRARRRIPSEVHHEGSFADGRRRHEHDA